MKINLFKNKKIKNSLKNYKKYFVIISVVLFVAIVTSIGFIIQYSRSPSYFPVNTIVTIPSGSTVNQAGEILFKHGIIRSALAYKIYTVLIHDGNGIKAGQYLFTKPESVIRVAYRTAFGLEELSKIKVTIFEGASSKDIANIIGQSISGISTSSILSLAKNDEGYLFPDTYFFYQNTTPKQVVDEMSTNFDNQLKNISTTTQAFIASSTKMFPGLSKISLKDIITMASIVEKEASTMKDRQIIAGILWKRLAENYPLQVDPPFSYYLDKSSSQLTLADLETNSPYNLYKNKGLPPTPIDNPGLNAILATINPIMTNYWYYLSDKNGVMHYATTYDGHLANKAKYLD